MKQKILIVVAALASFIGGAWAADAWVDPTTGVVPATNDVERIFQGGAIEGELPSKGAGGDSPSTSIAIRIDSETSLSVTLARSLERQPLVDADDVDTGIFYGTLDGYEGVNNVVVLKGRDGSVVTEVNDFRNRMVYKTITQNGSTTAKSIHVSPNPFDESHPHELYPPMPTPGAQLLAADYAYSGNVSSDVYVDLLVVYDTPAAAFAAGEGGITNFALNAVAKMNVTLVNSGLDEKFRFRLLGVVKIDADAGGDLEQVLDDVVHGNGAWAKVAAERDRVGADLVSILVDTGSAYGWTGLGYSLEDGLSMAVFKNYGFNSCSIRSVAISDTMTHEVGHNMGAGHADAEHMATEFGPQYGDWSSGYYFTAEAVAYHTVMAYDTDKYGNYFYSAPFFSTPSRSYKGVAVGDATHNNVDTLAKTYLSIANFRTPSTDIVPVVDPEIPVVPVDPVDPVDPGDGDDMAVSSVSASDIVSGYELAKAVTLMGCALDEKRHPVGMFELKVGKANKKTGLSKISGSYTPLGGKKVTLKAVEKNGLNIRDGKVEANFTINGIDGLVITIGADKSGRLVFAGKLGELAVTSIVESSVSGVRYFTIDSLPAVLDGVKINFDYLPTSANGGEAIDMGVKWVCAKAMSVNYKKNKGAELGSWVENNGKIDGTKTNRSGLKLAYAAKKASFKGSFCAYGLADGKFKKLKFSVTGVVVDGKVFGVSTYKKVNYSCTVK